MRRLLLAIALLGLLAGGCSECWMCDDCCDDCCEECCEECCDCDCDCCD